MYHFRQAQNYTPASRNAADLIVIHTMETPEAAKQALGCARWFAGELAPRFPAPRASAHFCVDADEVIQCVRVQDVAWHAPGANRNGVGIEHAGRARQTPEEWADDYSASMLARSAILCAELCFGLSIPVRFVDAGELAQNMTHEKLRRGITTHAEVTRAFPKLGTHTDPGPHFPMGAYLEAVREGVRELERQACEAGPITGRDFARRFYQ
jgi:N-acetyl-anhydromuramyl-L-alanine amidase AmpD